MNISVARVSLKRKSKRKERGTRKESTFLK